MMYYYSYYMYTRLIDRYTDYYLRLWAYCTVLWIVEHMIDKPRVSVWSYFLLTYTYEHRL